MNAPPPPPEYDSEKSLPRLEFLANTLSTPHVTHTLGRGQVPIDRVELPRKLR